MHTTAAPSEPHASKGLATTLTALVDDLARQNFPAGALYVVATPIGNIADISVRALQVLSLVDGIACEDTRNTGQLLQRYGFNTPLFAAHQHNEMEVAQKIVERLQRGERLALVSDAGTPAISDPGARIVDAVMSAGLKVIPIAGACAAVAALSASGLMCDEFHFLGFLPNKEKQRDSVLTKLTATQATLVFYEAPHRIAETLQACLRAFGGERQVVIAREISKLFEQIHRCRLAEAADWVASNTHHERGEFVVLIDAAARKDDDGLAEAKRLLVLLLEVCSVSQAATLAAKITGLKKNALYTLALALSTNEDSS
jgi:16S rRNA (cytidine1402-2'-O)-methyltransferase